MTQFDVIVRSGDSPARHHTFYFDDGNVVLNVTNPGLHENDSNHST